LGAVKKKQQKQKIVITDKALKHVPEEEREALANDIREMFENADELPGKPVLELPKGAKTCPKCNGPFELGPVLDIPGRTVQIYECDTCDEAYEGEPLN